MFGSFRDAFPRIILELPGPAGLLTVEFIVDTGFDGDLILPRHLVERLSASPAFRDLRELADGSVREIDVFELDIQWNGTDRTVEILALQGRPLAGNRLFENCRITIDLYEGGEVTIETP